MILTSTNTCTEKDKGKPFLAYLLLHHHRCRRRRRRSLLPRPNFFSLSLYLPSSPSFCSAFACFDHEFTFVPRLIAHKYNILIVSDMHGLHIIILVKAKLQLNKATTVTPTMQPKRA